MLNYVLSDSWSVEINNTWDEETENQVWDSDEPEDAIKIELIQRVENELDSYKEVIKANKEKLPVKLKGRGKVVNKQKALLEKINSI